MTIDGSGQMPTPAAELTYTEASRELDDIVAFFESEEVDVDQLVARLERATAIVDELDRRIRRTRAQVEEFVPRLEALARGEVDAPSGDEDEPDEFDEFDEDDDGLEEDFDLTDDSTDGDEAAGAEVGRDQQMF
jgi:exodeoxyribonuclease VII small subunit